MEEQKYSKQTSPLLSLGENLRLMVGEPSRSLPEMFSISDFLIGFILYSSLATSTDSLCLEITGWARSRSGWASFLPHAHAASFSACVSLCHVLFPRFRRRMSNWRILIKLSLSECLIPPGVFEPWKKGCQLGEGHFSVAGFQVPWRN